jgi:hypothetical protein
MKQNGYLVTLDDLSTMGLKPKGTAATGKGVANKKEIIDNYYVNESATPFANYANNECPRYEDIVDTLGLDFTITYSCTKPTQTISISSLSGGNGSYQVSSTTYSTEADALSGSTVAMSGSTKTYTAQSSSSGTSTRYVKVSSAGKTLVKSAGGCCDTDANKVSQSYTTCVGCSNYTVYKDTNPCSSTYLHYFVNNTDVGTTAPTNAACNTSANWTVVFGEYECANCNKYYIEKDLNPCSSTYNNTRRGSLIESNSTYCGGCCGQSTTATWTVVFGSYVCDGCNKRYVESDTNPCSATYQQTRTGGIAEANSTYCGGCCGQSTSAQWTVVFGEYTCSGCNKYYVEKDLNSCSPTYNQTRQGSLVESNSSYCGGCCGSSTAANWVVVFGSYTCVGCNKYLVETDTNSCSPTYQQTRPGPLSEANSTYCGGSCGQPTYYYYTATKYNCADCSISQTNMIVRSTGSNLKKNVFYFGTDGSAYKVLSATTENPDYIDISIEFQTTCSGICNL